MLKVECESCRAPYQIDERRVPAAGLKMRCPKCGHSFVVSNKAAPPMKGTDAPPAAAPPAAGPPAPAPKPPVPHPTKPEVRIQKQKTMVGIAPPAPLAAAPAPPAAPPPPAAPVPPPREKLPSDFPAALGTLGEADLPVVAPGLPASPRRGAPPAVARPPQPPAPPPAPAAKPAAPAFGDIDLDLPVVAADLPVAKPRAPAAARPAAVAQTAAHTAAARAAAAAAMDVDLPVVAPDLPAARRSAPGGASARGPGAPRELVDLPAVAAGLPAPSAGLPAVAAGLPAPQAALPSVAAGLPQVQSALPALAASLPVPQPSLPTPVARGFGEIDLPNVQESLPTATPAERHLPAPKPSAPPAEDPFGDFGELDLPREAPPAPPPPMAAAAPAPLLQTPAPPPPAAPRAQPARGGGGGPALDFGELDFAANAELQKKSRPSAPPPGMQMPPVERSGANPVPLAPSGSGPVGDVGGTGFGERDLGGGEAAGGDIATEAPIPQAPEPPPHQPDANVVPLGAMDAGLGGAGGFEASFGAPSKPMRERPVIVRRSSKKKWIVIGVLAAVIVGGAALQLTPYGAFGYLFVTDKINAGDYAAKTTAAIAGAQKQMGADTYDGGRKALDDVAAAHAQTPRARPLTTYAAFVEGYLATRYGGDPARPAHGKQWLEEIPANTDVKYLAAAQAAQLAAAGDWDKARKQLDAAQSHDASDPVQLDEALLRGEVELGAHDPAAALASFKKAAQLSSQDARAHWGIARAYIQAANAAEAKKEIDATLALSPSHPGALLARADVASSPEEASKDVATVLDGTARAKASPFELAEGYALRGWIELTRGGTAEARAAFDKALQQNPRNPAALLGQGELLFRETRYTEALTRFDTALQVDPTSIDGIVCDVKAKVALERLQDAKNQLQEAAKRFPKSMQVLMWLGQVEHMLGNNDAAEKDLKDAIASADLTKPDAVMPYVWLASLMSARGRASEATKLLDEAKQKLPDSAALQRAFGEVAEAQSDYEEAAARYRAALAKDPKDVGTTFRLGVVLRHLRKFDEAGQEFDKVYAADKDYPGLALERGLLFEESGDVTKAIELFQAALQKAPDDPDLQLRVAGAYVAINQPDKALPMLDKVLAARGNSAEAHYYKGRALLERGGASLADSKKELSRAVQLDPNRAEYHLYYGWAANESAELDTAKTELDRALSLDNMLPEAHWQRGVLECRQGAVDDGLKDLRRAIELRPTLYQVHAGMAVCYDGKNDRAASFKEWSEAVAGDVKSDQPHPEWRYRYGALLLDQGNTGGALPLLEFAADAALKFEKPLPNWVAPCEFDLAEALRKTGKTKDACDHYKRFLDIAPLSSPDHEDAVKERAATCGK